MNETKNNRWYVRIGNAIISGRIFDVSTNTMGYTKVAHLIAREMLKDRSEAELIELTHGYREMVKKNLGHAIEYLQQELGVPVYRSIKDGSNLIEYLTIDESYRDAKEKEIRRIRDNLYKTLNSQKEQLKVIAPRRDFSTLVNNQLKLVGDEKKETYGRSEAQGAV